MLHMVEMKTAKRKEKMEFLPEKKKKDYRKIK